MDYNFEDGKVYEGFKCVKQEDIKDIKTYGYIFEHEKTKARLVYLKNDDTNKVFSIAFRTPPTNNTGIPHIIEHSTLCGSDKFPVKEPFVELLKGSVNTFLNAMTFPDKTLYPVASTNNKDYMNLMSVYLDAVFRPNIYNKKEIFMQEGWHYELLNKKDPLTYKGVVYNEMKGVYSSPDSILFYESMKSLFPDNIYAKEYGGYPKEIPDLTYEEFLDFHSKYYHPSNSYIYLYGDLNPNEAMKYINDEYLSKYEYKDVDSRIIKQEKLSEVKYVEKPYAVSNDSEDISNKNLMSINYCIGEAKDVETTFATAMVMNYLMQLPASPLKKAILEKELCTDCDGLYESDMMQPMFSFIIREMKMENKDAIINLIDDELRKLVNDGLDLEFMEGIINKTDFEYRRLTEGDPLGLNYNYSLFQTWLYDGDPLQSLYFEEPINNIRSKFKDRYFEKFIEDNLLNNTHKSIVVLTPDIELKEKEENELKEKLANIKAKMTDKELNQIIKDTKRLIKLQMQPDSKKDLAKIPSLKISDIKKEAEDLKVNKDSINDVDVYYNEGKTNKITFLDFTFDMSKVDEENVPYINLLSNLLGEISTSNMSYEEITKKICLCAGDVDFASLVMTSRYNVDEYYPTFKCHMECLDAKKEELLNILKDIVLNTKFDEDNKLKEIISRLRVMLEERFVQAGHITVLKRIHSYYSRTGVYGDLIDGFKFYEFIIDLDNNFEERKEELKNKLEQVKTEIFAKDNCYVTYVGEDNTYEQNKNMISNFIDSLKDTVDKEKKELELKYEALNEGILTQSDVQYVGQGGNFLKLGYEYNGSIQVLQHILEYDYLWNYVRVKGGAYGSKLLIAPNGDFVFTSYRDPNLKETYKNYKKTYDYLKSFKAGKDFDKYIIGTIGGYDKPHNVYVKTVLALRRIKNNVPFELIQKERDEILGATPKQIKGYAQMLKDITNLNIVCTLGNERTVKDAKDIFKSLRTLKGNKE